VNFPNLSAVNFYKSEFYDVDFSEKSVIYSWFSRANLNEINFEGSDFSGMLHTQKFSDPQISSWSQEKIISELNSGVPTMEVLSKNISDGNSVIEFLLYNNFVEAELKNANMKNSNFSYANFGFADLSNADMERANMAYVYFRNANLAGANLEGANLEGANLEGANLEGANLNCFNHQKCN